PSLLILVQFHEAGSHSLIFKFLNPFCPQQRGCAGPAPGVPGDARCCRTENEPSQGRGYTRPEHGDGPWCWGGFASGDSSPRWDEGWGG
ncbi:hypothetical protein Nmel_018796, partial [Mimus melanotis]